jgi:hypothetical protein
MKYPNHQCGDDNEADQAGQALAMHLRRLRFPARNYSNILLSCAVYATRIDGLDGLADKRAEDLSWISVVEDGCRPRSKCRFLTEAKKRPIDGSVRRPETGSNDYAVFAQTNTRAHLLAKNTHLFFRSDLEACSLLCSAKRYDESTGTQSPMRSLYEQTVGCTVSL